MSAAPQLPAAKPRHIFVVADNVEELGGVQRFVRTLSAGLAARGHDVTLVGIVHAHEPHPWPADASYRTGTLYQQREPAYWKPVRMKDQLEWRKKLRERARRRIRADAVARLSVLFRSVPDGVVICTQIWAMAWVTAADTSHLHLVAMSHEQYESARGLTPASRGSTRYQRMRRLYHRADSFLLLTRDDADKYERDDFTGVGVMANPVSFFPDEPAALQAPRIVAMGRYAAQKRMDRLVDAFALVADDNPDWTLDLYGGGPREQALRDQVERLGLVGRVGVHGPVDDVPAVLLGASVFGLSSDFEGLPLSLAEAMACGVPCVAVDCAPGVRELITDGVDGLVVSVGVPALADGLRRLMQDAPLRRALGEQARISSRRYAPEVVMDHWEDLFAELDR